MPFYHEKGKEAYKPGLDRISNFLEFIKNPHKNLKFIHIGGTNGKGSTAHYISSILQESGYKAGLFTSPHFYDFRERIKVNKKKIDKDFITEFTNLNKKNIENNSMSFFELSFGLAVSYFNRNKVDIAIIEVGLGGRLDCNAEQTSSASKLLNLEGNSKSSFSDFPNSSFRSDGTRRLSAVAKLKG